LNQIHTFVASQIQPQHYNSSIVSLTRSGNPTPGSWCNGRFTFQNHASRVLLWLYRYFSRHWL